jgi:hypothetical protein
MILTIGEKFFKRARYNEFPASANFLVVLTMRGMLNKKEFFCFCLYMNEGVIIIYKIQLCMFVCFRSDKLSDMDNIKH